MGNQLEWRHFKYFLAVADVLHFRKAAEQLYISQPGLSRQIKQMEEELSLQLFERNSRKVTLTKAGHYLKTELEINFEKLNDILHRAKLINDGIDGNLRMGFIGSAMQRIIPGYLVKFRETSANTLVNLKEMDNNSQIQALLDEEIDIGFVRMERVPDGLEMHPVLEETFSLVVPKKHAISASNFKGLDQFKDEHFILFDASYSTSYYEKIMQVFDDSGFYPSILHSTVNASSIYRLVENNFGISIIPTSLQQGYDLDIKFIELTHIPQRTTLHIVWNKANTNPVLKSFLNVVHP